MQSNQQGVLAQPMLKWNHLGPLAQNAFEFLSRAFFATSCSAECLRQLSLPRLDLPSVCWHVALAVPLRWTTDARSATA